MDVIFDWNSGNMIYNGLITLRLYGFPFAKIGVVSPEITYLSVIGALMYLINCTRPDIAFAVNLLARHSANPTRRHLTGAKCILRYLNGTKDLGLFLKKIMILV